MMNCYMHILPGCIHIRTPALRKQEDQPVAQPISSVPFDLKALKGVISVQINQGIGSLSIQYDRKMVSSQGILKSVLKVGILTVKTDSKKR